MAIDRVNAVYLGVGKDSHGFRCSVLEDPLTKQQFLSYELEVWEERARYLRVLQSDNTPRFAWPAQLRKR